MEGRVEVCTSVAILTEMAGKPRDKFHWRGELIKATIRHIAKTAKVIKPSLKINILAYEPDNRILECAQGAGAEVIVTSDKHLLDLVAFEGIKIIRIADFFKIIKEDGKNEACISCKQTQDQDQRHIPIQLYRMQPEPV